jgi:ADP-ribose pyrophosphatase
MDELSESSGPSNWEVLQAEYLFQRPWLTVRQDCVRLPTGVVVEDYYVLEYPAWVNVVAVTAEERLVMVRQYRHGLRAVHYELPAGVVDASDGTPLAAAKRELLEETGYGEGTWSPLLTTSANPGTHSNLAYSFLAQSVRRVAEPALDESEDIQTCVKEWSEVWSIIEDGEIVQAMHLAPLLRYLITQRSSDTRRPE